jgi:hypothetical protein
MRTHRPVICRFQSAVLVLLAVVLLTAQPELVIVKEGTKQYHRPGCAAVKDGKGVVAMTRGQAEARGFKDNAQCDPAHIAAAEPSGTVPAPPVFVYLDGSRYYHRQDCKKLAKDPKKIALDQAGKEYWPCPTCKPPIRKRRGA